MGMAKRVWQKNGWQKNEGNGIVVNCIIFLPLIFLPLIEHVVEMLFDFAFEVQSDLIDVTKFDECPSAIGLEVVDAGHPIVFHRGFLFFGVFSTIAFNLNYQLQIVWGSIGTSWTPNQTCRELPIPDCDS